MTLFWTVTDGRDQRGLICNAKRSKYSGSIRGVAQANQLWKLRIKWPNLKPHPFFRHVPPQFTLDRHQTRFARFLLQLRPTLSEGRLIQAVLPCNGKVNRMACLSCRVQHRDVEIRGELSPGLELGTRQVEGTGAIPLSQRSEERRVG